MKRSIGIMMAAATVTLSTFVDSAQAQYYGRPNGPRVSLNIYIGGVVSGATETVIFSSGDRRQMEMAEEDIYDLDVETGYRASFRGPHHSGYYEVVDQGRHANYDRCRQVRTVVYDRSERPIPAYRNRLPRCVCLDVQSGSWVDVERSEYVVAGPRVARRSPYGSVTITQRGAPLYAPYDPQLPQYRPEPRRYPMPAQVFVAPSRIPMQPPVMLPPQQGYGRPMAPPIAGPATMPPQGGGGFARPGGPAPAVLPATPQAPGIIR